VNSEIDAVNPENPWPETYPSYWFALPVKGRHWLLRFDSLGWLGVIILALALALIWKAAHAHRVCARGMCNARQVSEFELPQARAWPVLKAA